MLCVCVSNSIIYNRTCCHNSSFISFFLPGAFIPYRLYWYLIECIPIDWRYSQPCWYFRPSFVNYCPSNLLSSLWFTSPTLPPFPKSMYIIYRQCVAGMWCGVVELCLRQEFNTLFWPDSEPTKLLYHPKQKPRRGGGFRQINTCRKVPYRSIFLNNEYLHCFLRIIFLRSHPTYSPFLSPLPHSPPRRFSLPLRPKSEA